VIDEAELIRRFQKLDQMRRMMREIHASIRQAHAEGRWPYPPPYDVRTDTAYWIRLRDEKRAREAAEAIRPPENQDAAE